MESGTRNTFVKIIQMGRCSLVIIRGAGGVRDSTPAEPGTRNAFFRTGRIGRCLLFIIRAGLFFTVCFHGYFDSLGLMSARSGEGWGLRDSTPAEPGTSNAFFRTGWMGRCLLFIIGEERGRVRFSGLF